jgi:transcriptional regulator with XRE-family HTH domain
VSRKSQRQIAQEAGFKTLNIVSMMKSGDAKLPLDRVPGLAKALEVDPAVLFRLAVAEYMSDADQIIDQIFGTITTQNEAEILAFIRELTTNSDPALTESAKKHIQKAFSH